MKATLVKKTDRLSAVIKSLNALTSREVLVGVPGTTAERREDADEPQGPMNNATLAYIHEHGSPAANIPARPFVHPGIEDARDRIAANLGKAAGAALDGQQGKVTTFLDRAGLAAQNSIRAKINSGEFAPLAEATLRARAARGRKGAAAELASRAAGNAPSNETARPLIDSGQLRNSITYVLRRR